MKATLLPALSIGTITRSSWKERIVFFIYIFPDMNFSIYSWHNMTFPFWKMVFVDVFVIWNFLNELINTSLYFLMCFLKTNLLWFSIFWTFGSGLLKPLIMDNIEVFCYNMTIMIAYKGIAIFITATFNWIRVFTEFTNI